MKIKRVSNYMAILRNYRNIIEANVSDYHMKKVLLAIQNKEAVNHSKLLPFRFYSAYKEISEMRNITNKPLDVLEKAIGYSVENMNKIPGKTAICIDRSGSMNSPVSANSTVRCNEIASLLGAMANKICDEAVIYLFDTSAYRILLSRTDNILSSAQKLCGSGGGTDISSPINKMISDNMKVDRIIVLSDNEANAQFAGRDGWYRSYTAGQTANKYREKFGQNVWIHAIDMQGYGTQQFMGSRTNLIAGWSEKVLDFILLAEEGTGSLIKTISDYVIKTE